MVGGWLIYNSSCILILNVQDPVQDVQDVRGPLCIHKVTRYLCLGNGYITTAVLREILAALDDALKPEDLDGIIAEIDTDGSGTVDFDGKYLLW